MRLYKWLRHNRLQFFENNIPKEIWDKFYYDTNHNKVKKTTHKCFRWSFKYEESEKKIFLNQNQKLHSVVCPTRKSRLIQKKKFFLLWLEILHAKKYPLFWGSEKFLNLELNTSIQFHKGPLGVDGIIMGLKLKINHCHYYSISCIRLLHFYECFLK